MQPEAFPMAVSPARKWLIGSVGVFVGVMVLAYLAVIHPTAEAVAASSATGGAFKGTNTMAYVRTLDKEGNLAPAAVVPKVVHSEEEWKKKLTPEQYNITRNKATEPAFCGGLLKNHEPGMYLCIGGDLPLFRSDAKFESGTG